MTVHVALLHNIVSPHVVPLFEKLGQQPNVALKVYFLAETEGNRRWQTTIGQRFQYTILPNWSVRLGREDLFTLFINPTVVPTLLRDGFDVLISVGWDSFAASAAFALSKLQRKPMILWSGSTSHEPSWRRTVSLPLVKLLVRGSNCWIAYGSRARDYLVQLGAAQEKVFVAYNTVDVGWFRARADDLRPARNAIRAELGLSDGPVILYVGQLIARKGVHDLLGAFELISRQRSDAQLLLVGYGQLEAELKQRAAVAGVTRVHFVGHVALPDLPKYYVAADAFVLPSHEEVWGLVLNEAAASALPLVTTDVTGASVDLVKSGVNGFSVPPCSPDELAAALLAALARAHEMGAASRAIVERFTYDQNVEAILRAISTAAGDQLTAQPLHGRPT